MGLIIAKTGIKCLYLKKITALILVI